MAVLGHWYCWEMLAPLSCIDLFKHRSEYQLSQSRKFFKESLQRACEFTWWREWKLFKAKCGDTYGGNYPGLGVCSHTHMASADWDATLRLKLFALSWKQLLLPESCFFSSRSPVKIPPSLKVLQNPVRHLKWCWGFCSCWTQQRAFLSLPCLLTWQLYPFFPSMNNVQCTLGTWQPSLLVAKGSCVRCVPHESPSGVLSWHEMFCFQMKAQLAQLLPFRNSQGAARVQSDHCPFLCKNPILYLTRYFYFYALTPSLTP